MKFIATSLVALLMAVSPASGRQGRRLQKKSKTGKASDTLTVPKGTPVPTVPSTVPSTISKSSKISSDSSTDNPPQVKKSTKSAKTVSSKKSSSSATKTKTKTKTTSTSTSSTTNTYSPTPAPRAGAGVDPRLIMLCKDGTMEKLTVVYDETQAPGYRYMYSWKSICIRNGGRGACPIAWAMQCQDDECGFDEKQICCASGPFQCGIPDGFYIGGDGMSTATARASAEALATPATLATLATPATPAMSVRRLQTVVTNPVTAAATNPVTAATAAAANNVVNNVNVAVNVNVEISNPCDGGDCIESTDPCACSDPPPYCKLSTGGTLYPFTYSEMYTDTTPVLVTCQEKTWFYGITPYPGNHCGVAEFDFCLSSKCLRGPGFDIAFNYNCQKRERNIERPPAPTKAPTQQPTQAPTKTPTSGAPTTAPTKKPVPVDTRLDFCTTPQLVDIVNGNGAKSLICRFLTDKTGYSDKPVEVGDKLFEVPDTVLAAQYDEVQCIRVVKEDSTADPTNVNSLSATEAWGCSCLYQKCLEPTYVGNTDTSVKTVAGFINPECHALTPGKTNTQKFYKSEFMCMSACLKMGADDTAEPLANLADYSKYSGTFPPGCPVTWSDGSQCYEANALQNTLCWLNVFPQDAAAVSGIPQSIANVRSGNPAGESLGLTVYDKDDFVITNPYDTTTYPLDETSCPTWDKSYRFPPTSEGAKSILLYTGCNLQPSATELQNVYCSDTDSGKCGLVECCGSTTAKVLQLTNFQNSKSNEVKDLQEIGTETCSTICSDDCIRANAKPSIAQLAKQLYTASGTTVIFTTLGNLVYPGGDISVPPNCDACCN